MPTTTFAGSDPAIIYGGRFSAPFSNAGITIIQRLGDNSEIRVVVTGTECKLQIFADGSTHRWTVDGGAEQSDSTGGNVNAEITLFTGLSDAAHTVVYYHGSYAGYSPEMFKVTGSSPAIAAPSGYTNTQVRMDASGVTNDHSINPGGAVEGYDLIQERGCIRFKATTGTLRFWCRKDLNSPLALVTDDDINSLTKQTVASGWSWTTFTGLDGANEHEYRVIIPNGLYVYAVMATGSFNSTALTPFPADYWQGDSITQASNITDGDAAPNFPQVYGILGRRGWQIQGTAGGTLATQGLAQKNDPGASSPTPTNVWFMWGMNDQAGGTTPLSTWDSAIDSWLSAVTTPLPSAKVFCAGIIDVTGSATNRASYNTHLSNRIAAFGDNDVQYIETDTLGLVSTSDGVHPDAAGALALGQYLYDHTLAVHLTVDESTLERGQAGQTLHCHLDGSGTSSSTADWTLAVGANSGSITALSNAGADPILTVTAPQATGTATLTFTPAGATAPLTVQDTIDPNSPTGVSAGAVVSYDVPLSFTLPSPSPPGETITATIRLNTTVIATGITSSPYTVTGCVDGDMLKVRSVDDSGNESADATVTFNAPSSGGGGNLCGNGTLVIG